MDEGEGRVFYRVPANNKRFNIHAYNGNVCFLEGGKSRNFSERHGIRRSAVAHDDHMSGRNPRYLNQAQLREIAQSMEGS